MRLIDLQNHRCSAPLARMPCRFVEAYWPQHDRCMIVLDDASGRITLEIDGFVLEESNLTADELISIVVWPQFKHSSQRLIVMDVQPYQPWSALDAVMLLPRHLTPKVAHAALDYLVAFARQLQDSVMGEFVARLLLDPSIGIPLLTAKGSSDHHHAYAGGLLVHTVECMQLAQSAAAIRGPAMQRLGEHTQVGALIHDLGKLQLRRAPGSQKLHWLPHQFSVYRLIGSHLQWLAEHDQRAESEFQATLAHLATPLSYRRRSSSLVAEFVALADQQSAIHLGDCGRHQFYAGKAANDSGIGHQSTRT